MTKYQIMRNVPLRVLRARLELVRRLELIFEDALRERSRYCDEHGINFRTEFISQPSEDRIHDVLYKRYVHYHCEYLTLRVNINDLQREARRIARNEDFDAYEYGGSVSELTR